MVFGAGRGVDGAVAVVVVADGVGEDLDLDRGLYPALGCAMAVVVESGG